MKAITPRYMDKRQEQFTEKKSNGKRPFKSHPHPQSSVKVAVYLPAYRPDERGKPTL